tara:strand:+ start:163 stop:525 length:363 start_codon:yes stop_codon:yes gene_type:complete
LFNGQTFHLALDEPKSLKTAFATRLEQQLKAQANAKHWTIGLIPALEIGNQPGRVEIFHGWVERTNPWQNKGIAMVEIVRTADANRLVTQTIKRFLHGVEIAHPVIDQTEIQSQSDASSL